MLRGRLDVHTLHILLALCNKAFRYLVGSHAFLNRFFYDLVIHVGKIGYKINVIAFVLKVSSDCVKYNHRPCITDMNKIIYGGAAYIHLDFVLL